MKPLFFLVFYFSCIFSNAQNKTKIIFINKKDTTRKISDSLPLIANIYTSPNHNYHVLIICVSDSSIVGLNYNFNGDTTGQAKTLTDYYVNGNKIIKNKSLKHIEKEK